MFRLAGRIVCTFCICIVAFLSCGKSACATNATELLDTYQIIAASRKAEPAQSDQPAKDEPLLSFREDGYIGAEALDNLESGGVPGTAPAAQADAKDSRDDNALTLYRACQLAILNHPLVESSRASKLQSDAEYGIAKSVYYPRIDLQSYVGPSQDLNTGTTEYGEGTLSVTQKIFDFGGIWNGVDSAELKALGASLRYARTREDIAALVVNSYFTILQSQELLQIYEESQDFYKKMLATFWERYNAGISSKADSQKVEVSLRTTESQLTVQNQQLKTAKLLLENIIKQKVSAIDPDIDMMKIEALGTLEESYLVALQNNVSLRAYTAEIESQEKVIKVRRAEYYPSLGYRVRAKNEFQQFDGYQSTLDAQLSLNWNLFNGHATDERIAKEKAVLRRMVATKQATELEIRNILSDAFNAYDSSVKEFQLAKDAYDSSVYLMGLYLSEFDLGIRTLLDLITAREGQTSAAVREVNARFARIRATLNIVLEEGRIADVLELPLDDSE